MEITLTLSESIILYELIARINKNNNNDLIEDQVEERILGDLERLLKSELGKVYKDNYEEESIKARQELKAILK